MAQVCVIGMVCLSITAPAIVISPSLPYFKVEQLLIPIVLAGYVWLLLAGIARAIAFNGMFLVGFLYFTCNIVSISYGSSILGHTVDPRDYYELPKVWLPVAFFTIAYEAELSDSALRRLLTCFSLGVLLVCFYAWAQFLGLGFTYKLNSFYSAGGHVDIALDYAQRVYATVGNANVLGALMTWCVILFALAARYRIGSRLRSSLVAFACLVTLVMTGSRYGIVTLSLGLLLVLLSKSITSHRRLPQLGLAIVLILLVFWTYVAVSRSNTRTMQRYQTLSSPLRIDSLRERLDQLWPPIWADFTQSPLVGHGPGKSFLRAGGGVGGYIDSEYLKVLREQGILGFLAFLGYYFYPLYLVGKGRRAAVRGVACLPLASASANLMVLQATLIMCVLALVMNIGMGTFYIPFLQGFLWLWLGIGARSAVTVRGLRSISLTPLPETHLLRPEKVSAS